VTVYVWVPLTGYSEAYERPWRRIDFSKAEDFRRTRWTRSGQNPNWSIGVAVE
jgi:hypothetical protein